MAKGNHIQVSRGAYHHHGIDCGDGSVIHYTGEVKSKFEAVVSRTPLWEFLDGGEIVVVDYGSDAHHPDDVVARAESRLGERDYDLIDQNCEHFARWCRCGDHRSTQVDRVAGAAVASVGGGAATAGGLGAVSAGGVVAGMSGSGIMSGLASAGGAIGGGAVAGLAVLGAAPAIVTNLALGHAFRDDPNASDGERAACGAARTAGVVGSAAGTAGAVAAVSGMGSVAGLSGAGIASGLAAAGGTIGGGMAAGTVLVVAAPAVAAAAVAYGAYKAVRWLWE